MKTTETGARKGASFRPKNSGPKTKGGTGRLARANDRAFFLMIVPAIFMYAVFYLYPTLNNLRYALSDWDGLQEPKFVGLKNFTRALTNDDIFYKVLGNNIEFTSLVVVFQTAFSLLSF